MGPVLGMVDDTVNDLRWQSLFQHRPYDDYLHGGRLVGVCGAVDGILVLGCGVTRTQRVDHVEGELVEYGGQEVHGCE